MRLQSFQRTERVACEESTVSRTIWYCREMSDESGQQIGIAEIGRSHDEDAPGVIEFWGYVEPRASGLWVSFTLDHAGEVRKVTVERADVDEQGSRQPVEGAVAITSTLLRGLPYGELLRQGRLALLGALRGESTAMFDLPDEFVVSPARTGRRGRPDRDFAVIASRYVENRLGGGTTKTLAEKLNLSVSQTRDLVAETRRRGFLSPTTQGRAGGDLTAKAKATLKEI